MSAQFDETRADMLLHNDIYVFAPLEKYSPVIASRSARTVTGDFFKALGIDSGERDYLCTRLSNGLRRPVIISAGERAALIITTVFPSSRLCIAVFPDIHNIPRRRGGSFTYAGIELSPACAAQTRPTPGMLAVQNEIEKLSADFRGIYGNGLLDIISEGDAYSVSCEFAARAEHIARVVGCSFDINRNGLPFGRVFNVDITLYTAYIICAAMFIRSAAADRGASVSFFSRNNGISVELEAEVIRDRFICEFDMIADSARRLNMIFELSCTDGHFRSAFCPVRTDISMLGLKNEMLFYRS